MTITGNQQPLGYRSACAVLRIGFDRMFAGCEHARPQSSSLATDEDNRTPQFGFVGEGYQRSGVLVLGLNPGVVRRATVQARDRASLCALQAFQAAPTPSRFLEAQAANRLALEAWRDESRHWRTLLGEAGLSFDDIAFSNCLPWRTAKDSLPSRLQLHAAAYYAWPLVTALKPRLVICFGCNAAQVFEPRSRRVPCPSDVLPHPTLPLPPHVVWPRDRVKDAKTEHTQARALAEINAAHGRRRAA